jgi:hypothetical protein
MLNYLHFETLYYRQQNLDDLFLINVFKNKIGCCSVKDIVGLCAPTKQIRDFSIFKASNVSKLQPFNKVRHSCKQHLQISANFQ